MTHRRGAATLGVEIQHKNLSDVSWGTAASFTGITATGVFSKDASSLKEEVRLAFTYSGGAAGDFTHVVIAAPAWRP